MDWTAITGIVVAGVVGPAVTGWFAIRRQDDQQIYERSRADLADLRALLAEAAKDLKHAEGLGGAMKTLLLEFGEGLNIAGHSEVIERFKEAGREAILNDARIAIRLEDGDPIARAHREAVAGFQEAAGALLAVGSGSDLVQTERRTTAGLERLKVAQSEFNRAARSEVGTRTQAGLRGRVFQRTFGRRAA